MNTIKFIGIFLLVLLVVFMIKGMIMGAMFFFFILRLAFWALLLTGAIYLYFTYIKPKK